MSKGNTFESERRQNKCLTKWNFRAKGIYQGCSEYTKINIHGSLRTDGVLEMVWASSYEPIVKYSRICELLVKLFVTLN